MSAGEGWVDPPTGTLASRSLSRAEIVEIAGAPHAAVAFRRAPTG